MSDQITSGEQPTAAAATPGDAAPVAAPVSQTAPTGSPAATPASVGTFGNARGSGLSRGKRPVIATAAAATPAAPAEYKPTSVEVITPVREYHNPFASETPASIPANEPAPAQAAPSNPSAVVETTPPTAEAVAAEPAPVEATSAPAAEPVPAPAPRPEAAAVDEAPAELKILPPAPTQRPTVSWGGTSHDQEPEQRPRREERQTFRPERREPRRESALEQRGPLPREPRAETPEKSGGFLGWLKGLFGGKPAETSSPDEQRDAQGHDGEHQRRRRRRRGGRGRGGYQGENRGPQDGQSQGGQPHYGGQPGRSGEGGGHRRRRRGGRGRHHDHRGGPRSEGHQGGGAI